MKHFNKHPQENNKNYKALKEIEARSTSAQRVYKNYQRAKRGTTTQREMNPVIEGMYHQLVKKAIQLFSILPNKEDRVMLEINLQQDPLNSHGLYNILTNSFFFYLECDIKSNYRVEYLFFKCPLEKEIQALIDKFALRSYCTEVVQQPDYPTFFTNCLRCTPERFIRLL
jgi:hypothetical protein